MRKKKKIEREKGGQNDERGESKQISFISVTDSAKALVFVFHWMEREDRRETGWRQDSGARSDRVLLGLQ